MDKEIDQEYNDINTILIFMHDALKYQGLTIDGDYQFGFLPTQKPYIAFQEKYSWPEERIREIINSCLTYKLVEWTHWTSERHGSIKLTEEGQARAIAAKEGKNRSEKLSVAMQITNLNIHGQAQIGNGNVQNISNLLTQLQQQIEIADAPAEQKKEAKSLISKLMEHPLICSILGGIAGGVTGNMK